jgi:tetratricopeptide (TPR) repeat protein
MMVVFHPKHIPPAATIAHPYRLVGKKLLIPLHASLTPAITASELADIQLWEWQVMHPSLGFVGFSAQELLSLIDLLEMPGATDNAWDQSHPGMPAMAPLRMIGVRRREATPYLDTLKQTIHTRPLNEIPMAEPPLKGMKKIKAELLKAFMWLIGKSGQKQHNVRQWMQLQLDQLQEKRDKELERLLHMFDENSNEALQYAIPLGSQHAGRGIAPPTTSLSKRDPLFNLGNLAGGGGPVDSWNVDRYYELLRSKYMRAAAEALENKDYKQAAYIYATLLQDYNLAAKALEQGDMYREAAALYKDYLNRPIPAAECLVKGGLLLEAIEIYKEQEAFETMGQLYEQLEQMDMAGNYYRKSVQVAQQKNDLLKAADILESKLHAPDEALRLLYRGWNGNNKPADHLDAYFKVVTRHTPEQLPLHMRKVFQKNTPGQQAQFIHVMMTLFNLRSSDTVKQVAADLGVRIISQQVKQGNTEQLFMLKDFLPQDKQLPADLFRFKSTVRATVKRGATSKRIPLPGNITWAGMIRHNLQLFIMGINAHSFYLLRISPEFEIEQSVWAMPLIPMYEYIVSGFPETNRLMIYLSQDNDLPEEPVKILPANTHFKYSITVSFPTFLQQYMVGFVVKVAGTVTQFSLQEKALTIWHFSGEGEMQRQYRCMLNGELIQSDDRPLPARIFYRNELYYFLLGGILYCSDDLGNCTRIQEAAPIYLLTTTLPMATTVFFGLTKAGIVTIQVNRNQLSAAGSPIAVSHQVVSMAYIPAGYLVAVGDRVASVFKVEGMVLKLLHEVGLEDEPEAVIEGSVRGEFIVLGRNKVLSVMDIAKL